MESNNTHKQKLVTRLSSLIGARLNCIKSDNKEWEEKHEDSIFDILYNELPQGSGLDGKWTIDYEKSTAQKIVLYMDYHAMDNNGYYDGWISFRCVITPDLQFGYNLNIIGNFGKYSDVKDYLHEVISYELDKEI